MIVDMKLNATTRARRRYALAFLLLVLGFASARYHWHEQLYHSALQTWGSPSQEQPGLWLPGYTSDGVAKPIAGITDDLSGITYDFDHDRLLAITNGGSQQILAIDRQGTVQARYQLDGFVDTEDLAYMGNGRVVLVEEIAQRLTFIQLPEIPQTIRHHETDQTISLGINLSTTNKGFEGVTYDRAGDRLFVIKERDPRQLFEIGGVSKSLNGQLSVAVTDRTGWINDGVFTRDLAGGFYHPQSGHLLLLSDQSKSLTELDQDGQFVSYLNLGEGLKNLFTAKRQPQGVTMDNRGNLYIVAEPNLLYSFTPGKRQR